MSCYVSNQTADYCNAEEAYCPECSANMYFDDDYPTVLVCDECGEKVDTLLDE